MHTVQTPIHELPPDYREVRLLVATEGRTLLWLNLAAIVPLVVMLLFMDRWWRFAQRVRGVYGSDLLDHLPWWGGVLAVVAVLVATYTLHELIPGLAIRYYGHKPRYGIRLDLGVMYATTDSAYFPRNQFVVIALAPLVVMSLVGMALMLAVSDALAYYIGLVIVLNASGAIGDLWMSWVVLRYPPRVLVRDEADRIRIYDIGQPERREEF